MSMCVSGCNACDSARTRALGSDAANAEDVVKRCGVARTTAC